VVNEQSDRLLGATSVQRWNYATAKAFGEALAFGYHRERGSEMIVVRIFNTVGPRQTGAYGMVLPRFVQQAIAGEDLTVYGDGSQSRCFTHVHDTVDALERLIDCPGAAGEVFNVGNPTPVSILDLARKVIERTGSDSSIRLVPYGEAFGEGFEELGCRTPDTSAVSRLVGWQATRSVERAVDDVVRYETAALPIVAEGSSNGSRVGTHEGGRVAG
jgi:UDP-glucose 4-epimerase